MAESIMIGVFLSILIVIQIKDQHKIKVKSKVSWLKRILSFVISIAITLIFWQTTTENQLKLFSFVCLIILFGFSYEGLGEKHLIKLGIISSDYNLYEMIQIEKKNENQSFVTFYKQKNNYFSLFFDSPVEDIVNFFDSLGLRDKLKIEDMLTD